MGRKRHLGFATFTVLRAIEEGHPYGFEVMDVTRLPAGTVYPGLSRLEELGLVRSSWESARLARAEKRPPRRYYRITAAGSRRLTDEAAHYWALDGGARRPEPHEAS